MKETSSNTYPLEASLMSFYENMKKQMSDRNLVILRSRQYGMMFSPQGLQYSSIKECPQSLIPIVRSWASRKQNEVQHCQ